MPCEARGGELELMRDFLLLPPMIHGTPHHRQPRRSRPAHHMSAIYLIELSPGR